MTSPAYLGSDSRSDRPRCGCCGQYRTRLAELGDTPGVFICAPCALWAARRAGGLGALTMRSAVGAANRIRRPWRKQGGRTFHSAIPMLTSTDLDRTAAFYAPLGFEVSGRHDGHLLLHDGPLELHFTQNPAAPPGECFLHVSNAAALWKRLREQRVDGVGQVADKASGVREFTLTDPDGNRVRIGSRSD